MSTTDPYQITTDRIVAALESGDFKGWHKPWKLQTGFGNMPRNLDGRYYTGINQLLLWFTDFEDQRYGTYRMIQKHGGQVRKGEHGQDVVLWKPIPKKNPQPGESKSFLLARVYRVFNIAQADWPNGQPHDRLDDRTTGPDYDPFAAAEQVWENYPNHPALGHGGDRAFYRMSEDMIRMPDRETFESAEAYFITLWHEATHSTGHPDRLARDEVGSSQFGSQPYGREELVAELGAAMIAARTGIVPPDIDQSAAYLANWIKAIKGDTKMLVQAAARAQKAADHILGPINPTITTEGEDA